MTSSHPDLWIWSVRCLPAGDLLEGQMRRLGWPMYRWGVGFHSLIFHTCWLAALPSLVILPTPEEPLSQPASSLTIHSLEAQSMRCLQPFYTHDTRDRPFHTQAQEILEVLLRHPSGRATVLRTWGQLGGGGTCL